MDRASDADEWKDEKRTQTVPDIPPLTQWPQQTSRFQSFPTNVEWQTTCQKRCYLMEILWQIGFGSVIYELLLSSYLWSNFQFSGNSIHVMGKFRAERTLGNHLLHFLSWLRVVCRRMEYFNQRCLGDLKKLIYFPILDFDQKCLIHLAHCALLKDQNLITKEVFNGVWSFLNELDNRTLSGIL